MVTVLAVVLGVGGKLHPRRESTAAAVCDGQVKTVVFSTVHLCHVLSGMPRACVIVIALFLRISNNTMLVLFTAMSVIHHSIVYIFKISLFFFFVFSLHALFLYSFLSSCVLLCLSAPEYPMEALHISWEGAVYRSSPLLPCPTPRTSYLPPAPGELY